MTITQKLKSLLDEKYVSEDGDEFEISLLPGLSDQEIDSLSNGVPNGKLPVEIRELLKFASGFEFGGLGDVTFNGIGHFGFEEFFPNSVQLAGDGFGNFWILDIEKSGAWGNVFYVCHDPAVVVKHSDGLFQFIEHIHEFGKNPKTSNLDIIHERIVMEIWNDPAGFIEVENARESNDSILREFALSLPGRYVVADLRGKQNKAGFAWGKFGPKIERAVRYETELLWALEKPEKKVGFFSKLFSR